MSLTKHGTTITVGDLIQVKYGISGWSEPMIVIAVQRSNAHESSIEAINSAGESMIFSPSAGVYNVHIVSKKSV